MYDEEFIELDPNVRALRVSFLTDTLFATIVENNLWETQADTTLWCWTRTPPRLTAFCP